MTFFRNDAKATPVVIEWLAWGIRHAHQVSRRAGRWTPTERTPAATIAGRRRG
jgi:hypothetical protein